MNKKNRNFKFTKFDFFALPLIFAVLFGSSALKGQYDEMGEFFNVEKTNVDFIVQTPSVKQVEDMSKLDHIESITPYFYFNTTAKVGNKSVKNDLFVVNNFTDLSNSLFSNDLLIEANNKENGNLLFIDENFANKNSVDLGSKLKVNIANKQQEFEVARIYEGDGRHSAGMLMCLNQGAVKENIDSMYGENYKYNGAYIHSKNYNITKTYLNAYQPLGSKLTREDFTSDELYNKYLEEFEATNHTLNTFYKDRFLAEKHNRYDSKMSISLTFSIVIPCILTLLGLGYGLIRIGLYIKHNLRKDIKNNFKLQNETPMFNKWCLLHIAYGFVFSVAYLLASKFIFGINFFNVSTFVLYGMFIITNVALFLIQMKVVKSNYNTQLKKIQAEEEKAKKAKEENAIKNEKGNA